MFCDLLQSGGQLQLSLDLSSQLHHLPPALSVLSPHQLYDGAGQAHPDEDVDSAEEHVAGHVVAEVGDEVTEADGGHGDEAEVERVKECPVFTQDEDGCSSTEEQKQ